MEACKYSKQLLIDLQGDIDNKAIIVINVGRWHDLMCRKLQDSTKIMNESENLLDTNSVYKNIVLLYTNNGLSQIE